MLMLLLFNVLFCVLTFANWFCFLKDTFYLNFTLESFSHEAHVYFTHLHFHPHPRDRSFTIKTSNMAHRESNHPRGKPVKGRASNLQVTGDKRERQHHRHHQVPSSSTSSEEDETDEEDEEKTAANCHRAAVVRCGWMFLRTFKFLDFLPPGEAHPHKCAFRDVS